MNSLFITRLVYFVYYVLKDILNKFIKKNQLHLYGIYCITGLYGCGKTVSMTYLALNYRNKFKDKILISTNFGFKFQDFPFVSTKQLDYKYDRPILFFFDEAQNVFPSSNRDFPKQVLADLTLNRKGNGKMIFWASQDHELVHKAFRRLTLKFGLVKTRFNRWTSLRWFNAIDYNKYFECDDYKKRLKVRPTKRISFIQSDYLRSLYNSFGYDNGEFIIDTDVEFGAEFRSDILKKEE